MQPSTTRDIVHERPFQRLRIRSPNVQAGKSLIPPSTANNLPAVFQNLRRDFPKVEEKTKVGGKPELEFEDRFRVRASACRVDSRQAGVFSDISPSYGATGSTPTFVFVKDPVVGLLLTLPETFRFVWHI